MHEHSPNQSRLFKQSTLYLDHTNTHTPEIHHQSHTHTHTHPSAILLRRMRLLRKPQPRNMPLQQIRRARHRAKRKGQTRRAVRSERRRQPPEQTRRRRGARPAQNQTLARFDEEDTHRHGREGRIIPPQARGDVGEGRSVEESDEASHGAPSQRVHGEFRRVGVGRDEDAGSRDGGIDHEYLGDARQRGRERVPQRCYARGRRCRGDDGGRGFLRRSGPIGNAFVDDDDDVRQRSTPQ
mmetsp:Transcript_24510/g.53015  ORF Transcript_24510/g.53015 Transcript_24510/m.53015 type:complete len:239 (-) Transcript_24510:831-1547(-)